MRDARLVPTSDRARGRAFAGYALSLVTGLLVAGNAAAQMPAAIAAPDEATVVTLHAEGAQIYECKAGSDGKLAWTFREPIATLLLDGKTVGHHYAGPSWEHVDGSAVTAKATGRGSGTLSGITTVQRINTQGGVYAGSCEKAGTFTSAPYRADYVFLREG